MKEYDHKKIEKKWQAAWEKSKIFQAKDSSKKPKFYSLIEFPYPSGDGLHVGHIRSNTAMDIISRKRRTEGYNVLYPIGWDAFGLPTENYAIKTGKQPALITKKNADIFRRQLKAVGFSFDWSREINTTDPKYYKWTQWIFLQFFKKGLAYKAKMTINWCPKDKIGLANEEVIAGCCERCGTPVEKREKEQWMMAITKYADRLDKDLDKVDYLPKIKLAQRNWIGKSKGAEINFAVDKHDITIFTTRPDTIFGATFIAVSPEMAKTWLDIGWPASEEIKKYIKTAIADRMKGGFEEKEKTGIAAGFDAINPANKEKIPVWIVNYVLGDVGTGAIMGVPAHDERDGEFAKKYNIPIKHVVMPVRIDEKNPHVPGKKVVFRKIVMAIVKNPKTGKYLVLERKEPKWTTFVIGGVEQDEDSETAARREVLEESGYKNLKLIRVLGGPVYSEFYAGHKGENRIAHNTTLFFELENDEQEVISSEETTKHAVAWIDFKDINRDRMAHEEIDIVLERLQTGNNIYAGVGKLVNSGKFDGMDSEKAKKEIIKFVGGKEKVSFKLRDWIFSRQRYWGEPIPVINCEKCGLVPVPDKDLPVELPKVKNYQPTDSGESPLANISKWVNVKCPKCKGKAKRETDTMPNWAGSSWYYLRYTDPKNSKAFASPKNLKYWTPVDWYNGGNEHTTLHLLYSRFWHKFLFDQKLVPTDEPYMKRTSHGLILAEGGEKMSKSRGNVVNPDVIVNTFGADTLRLYEMFMGPFDQAIAWSEEAIIGPRRFLEKVWRIGDKILSSPDTFAQARTQPDHSQKHAGEALLKLLNKTIKKVTEDIDLMRFNTAVSALMILATEMEKSESVSKEDYKKYLQILSPFAPHIAEELWSIMGEKKSISLSTWPIWDENMLADEEVKIVIQINGKVRAEMMVGADTAEETVKEKALQEPAVVKFINGAEPKKIIYVKNRLINIVI